MKNRVRFNLIFLIVFLPLTEILSQTISVDYCQLGLDIDGEAAGDISGYSVSMNASGDRMAIGAPFNDGTGSAAGHVRVYEWDGMNWVQLGGDIDGEAAVDFSGFSVSMNASGDRMAIGANGNDGTGSLAGHVRVYEACTLCDISALSVANISSCNPASDAYTADVTVTFTSPPTIGTLDLTGDETASVAVGSLDGPTSHTFFGVEMPADGGLIALTAAFSDNGGCTFTDNNLGTAPQELMVTASVDSNVSCNGFMDGGGTATVTGGAPTFTYIWSNSATTASITGVAAGTYSVTVTDNNNCSDISSISITVEDNILPTISCVNTNVSFNGEQQIDLDQTGIVTAVDDNCGVASVDYSPDVVTVAQAGENIPVTVIVTDTNGNTAQCAVNVTVSGLPNGWSQEPDGIGCADGNSVEYDFDADVFEVNSSNCYYAPPFTSDESAFVQRTLCGNGSITAQVTSITGGLGWAGVTMRESNAPGARKIQLTTNLNSIFSRREVRTVANGPAMPQQFRSFNRHWLRIVRQGNQFTAYTSTNGINWVFTMAANINIESCIEIGLVVTNFNQSGTVTATFANVDFTGIGNQQTSPPQGDFIADKAQFDYELYPNPTPGGIFLDLQAYIGKPVAVEIHNTQGQLIK